MHARALLLVLGAVAARPSLAAAQATTAQRLFDEGRRLLAEGKRAEACAAFDASEQAEPRVTTELNAAACREQNGELATAWAAYQEAERMARAGGQPRLAQVAVNHAQKLAARVSRLTISVPPDRRIPGLEVLRADQPVDPASWDRALPVDGGSVTIAARAPGYEPWSTSRTIKGERDAQTVVVPRLAEIRSPPVAPDAGPPAPPVVTRSDAPAPADAPRTDAPRANPPRTNPPRTNPPRANPPRTDAPRANPPLAVAPIADRPSGPSLIAPIAVGVAAVALGGAGLAFELRSESTYNKAKTTNQQGLLAVAGSYRDSAVRDRYIAQGLAAAAIGCAGVGVYLFVRGRGERPAAAAVLPVASSGLAGVALSGRW
ncbi:MAG TPA: hypothetical protein VHT91_27585 [Kofleriaceae bacterium]|jgi:hypothetical protein|nr:hypothetical protein [Kofleriaceae bacterium]